MRHLLNGFKYIFDGLVYIFDQFVYGLLGLKRLDKHYLGNPEEDDKYWRWSTEVTTTVEQKLAEQPTYTEPPQTPQ